jgi:hypothetical protein
MVRAEAEADLAEAYQWYEQQVRGLGGEFLLCVDAVMASIERLSAIEDFNANHTR